MRRLGVTPAPTSAGPAGRQLGPLLCILVASACAAESPWTDGDDKTVAIAKAWAAGECERVVELAPGYRAESVLRLRTVSRWYGECLVTLGEVGRGITVLKPLAQPPYDASTADGAYALGRAHFTQALSGAGTRWARPAWGLAEAAFDVALEVAPQGAKAVASLYYRGRARLEQRETAGAVDDLLLVANSTGAYVDNGLYYLGRAYYKRGSETAAGPWALAIEAFDRLLATYPESVYTDNAAYFRARALERRGDSQEARDAYEQLISDYSDSPYLDDAGYHLTLLRLDAGDCTGAAQAANNIPADSPKRAAAANSLAFVCGS